jgi:hypothetical protein
MSRRFLLTVLLALALAGPVAGAAAKQDPLLPPLPPRHLMAQVGAPVAPERRFLSGFSLDAGDHYRVGVMTFGSAVVLIVANGSPAKGLTEAVYLARGVATPERLQATFGKFGRVSMRFRESRHRPWFGKRRRCRGADRLVRRRGVFVGNLRFRGEGGYVSVRAHRAKGVIKTVAAKCERPRRRARASAGESAEMPVAGLFAADRKGVDLTNLLALRVFHRRLYLASHQESRGRLAIVELAFVREDGGRFAVNEELTGARISPPRPFHGTGRYSAAPDGTTTWDGNLSVNFPGAPRFPLTGPQFEVLLGAPF